MGDLETRARLSLKYLGTWLSIGSPVMTFTRATNSVDSYYILRRLGLSDKTTGQRARNGPPALYYQRPTTRNHNLPCATTSNDDNHGVKFGHIPSCYQHQTAALAYQISDGIQ